MVDNALGDNDSKDKSSHEYDVPKNKHLPSFSHDAYPTISQDGTVSPRMKDEVWTAYEQQSENKAGAT